MTKKSNKLAALNMTQIDAEADGGTVVISGNNVFATGKAVRVNVRSASVVSGVPVQTGISVTASGNVRINNSVGGILGESVDDDEDEDAVFYEGGEEIEEDDDYDIDEDN